MKTVLEILMDKNDSLWFWGVDGAGKKRVFKAIRNGSGDVYISDLKRTITYGSWSRTWKYDNFIGREEG